ncbi:putative phosphosulfolactate synthase [Aneurinibacillus aneurinilyticus ATCC 12856]|uniref:Putative phosphosulfolactate synthase n=1 Tax=Aneurinibacillus aneurinilyticus ATCC 12856 TaxID=649747 RepID=U1XB73_ANEAE|nr:putative phosphosulfolactate synthase [Aneurinibacillus aneurinilyticus ATCC 12856]
MAVNHPDVAYHPRLVDPAGERVDQSKDFGLTMIIDKGIGLASFEEFLQLAGQYVNYIKLGFGTTILYPPEILRKKLFLAQESGVALYPGGTLFEIAYYQGVLKNYLDSIEKLGFSYMEISDGTIDLPTSERHNMIREITARGFTVITECGKKAGGSHLSVEDLQKTLYSDLEHGASYVIVEGRESGTNVGIYDKKGRIDTEFLLAVEQAIPADVRKRLIWEAPQKNQQIELLYFWGRNVNMGNIQFEDAYNLECLRRGLRFDTFILGRESSAIQADCLTDYKNTGHIIL